MLRCLLIDIHIRNLCLVYDSYGCHLICHMESLLGYPLIFGVIDSLLDKETYIYILTDVAISSMKLQFTFVSPTIDNDICLYQAMMYIT